MQLLEALPNTFIYLFALEIKTFFLWNCWKQKPYSSSSTPSSFSSSSSSSSRRRPQGNLEFEEDSDEARVKDRGVLNCIAHLLCLEEEATMKALCSRILAAQGDVMEKSHTVEQAKRGRDAFAKVE